MLPESVQTFVDAEIADTTTDYSDLRCVVLNGTLKRSPEPSNTEALVGISRHIMTSLGVRFDSVRIADHTIPPGVQPDMREFGYPVDDFPDLYDRLIEPADILILATPIWLGDQSSLTRIAIERLYGYSGCTNDKSQWSYYGKAAGAIITGNEDGGKHCAAQLLYALQHIGCTIPPQADSYWTGEAGPGPSYLDEGEQGARNNWTTRNTVFLTWNLLHLARLLKDAGGYPPHGNRTSNWDLSHPDAPNPEYRH